MRKLKSRYKTLLAFVHDSTLAILAFILAIALRYSFISYNFLEKIPNLPEKIFIVVLTQEISFVFFGLYKGLWRFSSTHDLKQIVKASLITVISTFIIFELTNNRVMVPRSSMIIYFMLLILFAGGGRFLYRLLKESRVSFLGENALIIGAGNAAEQLIRDFRRNPKEGYNFVGMLDDAADKMYRTIHGIKVIGTTHNISEIVKRHHITQIFIAIPSASSSEIRNIVNQCNEIEDLDVKILPSVRDILNKKISFSSLRQIDPDDLLGRDPVSLDLNSIGQMLTNKNILISGAGGSIGSELTLQVLKFKPKTLCLLDVSEFLLYEIDRKVKSLKSDIDIISIVGDIRNKDRISSILRKHSIDNIYHAAAYKQVPLMEHNACESILTNIQGTKTLAEAAKENKVKRFVMISTDKAVNPTNVMGATKRVAEMICQELSCTGTKFTTVRFGNVLGSNGSVIPLFKEQIKNGGPVTVTHKDITRYFMSIPEAAQLVLQAGSMGNGGEIFVLNMGEPVKIYDFAKQMIKLSGFQPDRDIEIKVIGLRPGEKLYEELLADEETTLETPHEAVRVACSRNIPTHLTGHINSLISASKEYKSNKELKYILKECVPEYIPDIKTTESEESNTQESQKQLH